MCITDCDSHLQASKLLNKKIHRTAFLLIGKKNPTKAASISRNRCFKQLAGIENDSHFLSPLQRQKSSQCYRAVSLCFRNPIGVSNAFRLPVNSKSENVASAFTSSFDVRVEMKLIFALSLNSKESSPEIKVTMLHISIKTER